MKGNRMLSNQLKNEIEYDGPYLHIVLGGLSEIFYSIFN